MSVLNTVFIPDIVLIGLRAVDLQIRHMMAFWKSLYVQFIALKLQLMNRCILGDIGHGVKAVPRRSEPEQQIW